MIIELSADSPPRLTDADRLDRLHAVGSDTEGSRYDELCQPGPDSEHVWIDIALLRAAGSEQVDDVDYESRFDAMIAYASKQGWLDATRTRVRAHIEG